MDLPIRNLDREEIGSITVADPILQAPDKTYVVWEAIRHYHAGKRRGTHSTKTRSDVRGGGRKPWTQKGTGRARHGSTRSPLWVKGGVAHGPKPRSYAYRFPRKKELLARRIVLADRLRAGHIRIFNALMMDQPKTKAGVDFIERADLQPGRDKILIIDSPFDRNFVLSIRNIPFVILATPADVSIYDLTWAGHYVFTEKAFNRFQRMCQP